jgi:hypothetical protein
LMLPDILCNCFIKQGEITDGKTMIALFWAEKHLNGNWPA